VITDENPQPAVKLRTDHHALAGLHMLGGPTRQL
jgi:hypothetical protein